MPEHVRVRYAPSPTGEPHLGNIRTAAFNWLFVQHEALLGNDAQFIVRIEDTDQGRLVDGATEAMLESLKWLGLEWDEGPVVGGPHEPYVQSQRLHLYHAAVKELLTKDKAYRCYCSPERLATMRQKQQREQRESIGYDRQCRQLDSRGRSRLEANGIVPVIRFKSPMTGTTECLDLIRGKVSFENRLLDDFVLLKSDHYPTYHLASVVDDHAMNITHVLRAEEWLSSLARHVLIYEALAYNTPSFAHLPMILGTDRSKLSKRHGATSVTTYQQQGYLPDALLNFLALLGWSLDDHTEILSRRELIEQFTLDRIGQSAAIFNIDKLEWMNGMYIRKLSVASLTDHLLPMLRESLPKHLRQNANRQYVLKIAPLIQNRIKTLNEAIELMSFFFDPEIAYGPESLLGKQMDCPSSLQALQSTHASLNALRTWDAMTIEASLRALSVELNLKTGQLFGIIRIAVTGKTATPPLFETMEVLGETRCLARLKAAQNHLAPTSPS